MVLGDPSTRRLQEEARARLGHAGSPFLCSGGALDMAFRPEPWSAGQAPVPLCRSTVQRSQARGAHRDCRRLLVSGPRTRREGPGLQRELSLGQLPAPQPLAEGTSKSHHSLAPPNCHLPAPQWPKGPMPLRKSGANSSPKSLIESILHHVSGFVFI